MWKKTGKLFFALLLTALIALPAVQAEEEVKLAVSMDRQSVILGDSIYVTVKVEGTKEPETPTIEPVPGFDIKFRGVRHEGFSSTLVIVNGKKVQDSQSGGGFFFDYALTPREVGKFQIPSLTILYKDKSVSTNAFDIEVLDQSEKRDDVFVEFVTDRPQVYLGEKVAVTFKWYFNRNIQAYRIEAPWLDGLKEFLVSDPPLDPNRNYQRLHVNDQEVIASKTSEIVNGEQYAVISFQKILTPIRSGEYVLDPVFLKCDLVTGYERSAARNSFFDDFFGNDFSSFFGGRAITEPFATRSEPLKLNVLAVPETGKPASYTGAVGQFELDAKTSPTTLRVGEPVTLTLTIRGEGNLEELTAPPLADIEGFKSYEPSAKSQTRVESGRVAGEHVFERVYVAKTPGDFKFPAVEFSYFDPVEGAYKTLIEGPFDIHVEPSSEKIPSLDPVTAPVKMRAPQSEIQQVQDDIHYIKTLWKSSDPQSKHFHQSWIFWLMGFAFPLAVFLGFAIHDRHRRQLEINPASKRKRDAYRIYTQHIREAEAFLKKRDSRMFYATLSRALNGYLADKLDLPQGSLWNESLDVLRRKIEEAGLADELTRFHERFEIAAYSSMRVDEKEMKKDLSHCEAMVQKINRAAP